MRGKSFLWSQSIFIMAVGVLLCSNNSIAESEKGCKAQLVSAFVKQNTLNEDLIKVSVIEETKEKKKPMKDVLITLEIVKGECWIQDKPDPNASKFVTVPVSKKTNKDGETHFSILVGNLDKPIELRVTTDNPEITPKECKLEIPVPKEKVGFGSDLVNTEVILGSVLQNKYKDTGETEGFTDVSFLGQVTFDTLWKKKSFDFHTRLDLRFGSKALTDKDQNKEIDDTNGDDNGDEKSSGEDSLNLDPSTKFTDYAQSLSGTVKIYWEPKFMSHYSPSSNCPGKPVDAIRIGLFLRGGILTRDTVDENDDGDMVISHYGAGFRLTHHQTRFADFNCDRVNTTPLRYLEYSCVIMEEFDGEKDQIRHIIETAFTLPGFGWESMPFYAGLYSNFGDGPDEIRLFIGAVFELDKLVSLVKKKN